MLDGYFYLNSMNIHIRSKFLMKKMFLYMQVSSSFLSRVVEFFYENSIYKYFDSNSNNYPKEGSKCKNSFN